MLGQTNAAAQSLAAAASPLEIVPTATLAPGCALGASEEADAFARMSAKERADYTALIVHVAGMKATARDDCEFALDVIDLDIDPDRTAPGRPCRYSRTEQAALESLPITAQIPLMAHPCWWQESLLRKLSTFPAEQRPVTWLQLQTYHPDTCGTNFWPDQARFIGEARQAHRELVRKGVLPQ